MGQSPSSAQLEDKYFVQKVKLGQGSFGTVWRAVERSTQRIVAIKQLDKASLPRRGVTHEDIEREIAMMRAASHENLIQLFDSFEDNQHIYLALEYCDGGDFGDKMMERGMDAKESEVAEWMRQICSGIVTLHSKSICHRDIKPDNFMVSTQGGQTLLKLTDFGLAIFAPPGKQLTEKCGTPAFMAPEQHNLPKRSHGYTLYVDVWAAGVSMYMVMFGGRHPFMTERGQLDERLLLDGVLDFRVAPGQKLFGFDMGGGNLRFTEPARNLCSKMVEPDETRRVSFEDCLRSPWIHLGRPAGGGGATNPSSEHYTRLSSNKRGANGQNPFHANDAGWSSKPPWTSEPTVEMQAIKDENWKLKQQLKEEKRARGLMLSDLGELPRTKQEGERERNDKHLHTAKLRRQTHETGSLTGISILAAGTKCRYHSNTYGWLNAIVEHLNDNNGTYDLDVRQNASWDKISPAASSLASDAWRAGTFVMYHSSSANRWLPAVVLSFNEVDWTYNLDLRDHADVDRIRVRVAASSVSSSPPASPELRMPDLPLAKSIDTAQHQVSKKHNDGSNECPASPQRPPPAMTIGGMDRDGSAAAPLRIQDLVKGIHLQPHRNISQEPRELSPPIGVPAKGRLSSGMFCMVLDRGLAIVEGSDDVNNTYTVSLVTSGGSRPLQVGPEQIRAPNSTDPSTAWPAGLKVCYESSSLNTWVNGTIICASSRGKYNLDVREAAAPDKIRPR